MNIKILFLMSFLLVVNSASSAIKVKTIKSKQALSVSYKGFSAYCNDMPLQDIINELSEFYGVNILIDSSLLNKNLTLKFNNQKLAGCLDSICWLLGSEWRKSENIYYLGGKQDYFEVVDSIGFSNKLKDIYKENIFLYEDKIIVRGNEATVKRIVSFINKLKKKNSITIRIWAYEISDSKALELGLDIDKFVKYSFSWESLATASYNPIQSLAVSFTASLKADQTHKGFRQLLNTSLNCSSGKKQVVFFGDETDREVFQTGVDGRVFRSGFSTVKSGLRIELDPYFSEDQWFFNCNIKNSVAKSSTNRIESNINNFITLKDKPVLLARVIKEVDISGYTKGIPFLSSIPWVGFLFRITSERKENYNYLYFIEKISKPFKPPINDFSLDILPFSFYL